MKRPQSKQMQWGRQALPSNPEANQAAKRLCSSGLRQIQDPEVVRSGITIGPKMRVPMLSDAGPIVGNRLLGSPSR